MKTQFDYSKRVVSLENLSAMCDRNSGTCHRFEVVKVTPSRVHVAYSNPDEYGNESPMTAVLPCYPSAFDGNDNPAIVLEIVNVVGDNWDGEGWQAFSPIFDCPELYRDPATGEWLSREEIESA